MEPASPKIEASTLEKNNARSGSLRSSISQNSEHEIPETASDIDWQYLTFETDLPPTTASSNSSSGPDGTVNTLAVPCPDLDKFLSPFEWSDWQKTYITWIACVATVCAAVAAGAYSSGEAQMAREWHVSGVATEVGITTFTSGFSVFPMFLAPFSEINGRRPVFIASGLGFLLFNMACALVPSYAGMLVCRFVAGGACSTFSTISGGVVSDLYHAKDRNAAMTLLSTASLFGTGLGPLVGGFIAQHTTWRWIFYAQLILDGVLLGFIITFFKETRGSVLLSRKARALNKWYEQLEQLGIYGVEMPSPTFPKTIPRRIRWKTRSDEERASIFKMITISLYRPFRMLATEPVVFFFSLWAAFSWAVLYMTFSAIPLVFTTTYGFNLEESGGVFSAISIASVLFLIIAISQDKLARRYLSRRRELFDAPEGWLFFACVESALLPIGCIWFGVTGAYPDIPWIVPTLGLGCVTMGIFSIYLAVFNYLADTYHRYASSALAAQSFCRNMLGGVFPLFTAQMFKKLTFQGAGGLLGGIGFLLTLVPWVLILFGPRIRARSKLASEIVPGHQ